jgi:hypothetical protein
MNTATQGGAASMRVAHRMADWPSGSRAYPGLIFGWQGAAWVRFQQDPPVSSRAGASIARRIEAETSAASDSGDSDRISMFVGSAASALISAHGVRSGIVATATLRRARARLVHAARRSRDWDVNFGAAGALLACSEMETVLEGSAPRALLPVLRDRVLAAADAMSRRPGGWTTGMAHGLAGAMMALECGVARGFFRLGNSSRQRHLAALVGAGMRDGQGAMFWPQLAGDQAWGLQSWCHGTPGVTLALLALAGLTGQAAYGELAEAGLAGMEWLVDRAPRNATLCCGGAGFGQIFVEAYRMTRQTKWLDAARRFAHDDASLLHRSLFKGTLGLSYLGLRLRDPLRYPMPGLGLLSAS